MLFRLVCLCLLVGVALSTSVFPEPSQKEVLSTKDPLLAFKEFVVKHNKNYDSDELQERFTIFRSNLDKIDELNAKHPHAVFGVSKFADLTAEEFKKHYLSNTYSSRPADAEEAALYSDKHIGDLPKSFDWRTKGAVTPVKNQGMCGSCWAFSATGNVEGQWFLAGHTLVGLSEQNLVDCDHECTIYDGQQSCDEGCDGGLQPNAYTYIIKNNGIDKESSYPYEGVDDTCRYKAANRGAAISNWTFVSKNEDQMAAYMVAHGPLAIAADAVEWQFYVFGIFEGPCGTELDHGILIVGYGEEIDWLGFTIKYWIVKNSWGADWGVNGYLYIVRGVGECGLNTYVTSAIINK